jgi:hypothetical protein
MEGTDVKDLIEFIVVFESNVSEKFLELFSPQEALELLEDLGVANCSVEELYISFGTLPRA